MLHIDDLSLDIPSCWTLAHIYSVSLWYQIRVYYRSYQHAELRRAKVKLWALDQMKSQPSIIISFSSFPQLWPQLCRKKTHNRSSQTGPTRKSHKWESNYAATHLADAWHTQVLLSACHIFLKSCAAIAVSVTTGSCNFKKVAETLKTWYKKSTQIIQHL